MPTRERQITRPRFVSVAVSVRWSIVSAVWILCRPPSASRWTQPVRPLGRPGIRICIHVAPLDAPAARGPRRPRAARPRSASAAARSRGCAGSASPAPWRAGSRAPSASPSARWRAGHPRSPPQGRRRARWRLAAGPAARPSSTGEPGRRGQPRAVLEAQHQRARACPGCGSEHDAGGDPVHSDAQAARADARLEGALAAAWPCG